jgi:hypothetical protein
MSYNLRRLAKYLVLALLPCWCWFYPHSASAAMMKVIFEDSFQRARFLLRRGPSGQEYLVRRTVQTQANAIPVAADTAWSIRGKHPLF